MIESILPKKASLVELLEVSPEEVCPEEALSEEGTQVVMIRASGLSVWLFVLTGRFHPIEAVFSCGDPATFM